MSSHALAAALSHTPRPPLDEMVEWITTETACWYLDGVDQERGGDVDVAAEAVARQAWLQENLNILLREAVRLDQRATLVNLLARKEATS